MTIRIPSRLAKDPLLEAVWELRFSARPGASHVLPGLLYSNFRREFPKIVRLPLADAPDQLVESQPSLWYLPRLRFEGEAKALQVAWKAVTLNFLRPYPGWKVFSSQIADLMAEIRRSEMIEIPERFSFKYLNLLPETDTPWLSLLNVDLRLGAWNVAESPVQIRAQIRSGDFDHTVQIAAPATVDHRGTGLLKGTVVEIETASELRGENLWDLLENSLNPAHAACKEAFFTLLRHETVDSLQPEFEE
ncbi:MAG: TIGR04255 family protein [Bryobacteraceae bacterium]